MSAPRQVALGLAALLAACGTGQTGYERAGNPAWGPVTGYSDQRIGPDEYGIVVLGSPSTTAERVADIALLRAARLAQEQGRAGFVVTNTANQSLAGHVPVSVFLPMGVAVLPVVVGETASAQPRAILVIRLSPPGEPPPPGGVDAAQLVSELGPRVPGFAP